MLKKFVPCGVHIVEKFQDVLTYTLSDEAITALNITASELDNSAMFTSEYTALLHLLDASVKYLVDMEIGVRAQVGAVWCCLLYSNTCTAERDAVKGRKDKYIADRLGVGKSTVWRAKNDLTEKGLCDVFNLMESEGIGGADAIAKVSALRKAVSSVAGQKNVYVNKKPVSKSKSGDRAVQKEKRVNWDTELVKLPTEYDAIDAMLRGSSCTSGEKIALGYRMRGLLTKTKREELGIKDTDTRGIVSKIYGVNSGHIERYGALVSKFLNKENAAGILKRFLADEIDLLQIYAELMDGKFIKCVKCGKTKDAIDNFRAYRVTCKSCDTSVEKLEGFYTRTEASFKDLRTRSMLNTSKESLIAKVMGLSFSIKTGIDEVIVACGELGADEREEVFKSLTDVLARHSKSVKDAAKV